MLVPSVPGSGPATGDKAQDHLLENILIFFPFLLVVLGLEPRASCERATAELQPQP